MSTRRRLTAGSSSGCPRSSIAPRWARPAHGPTSARRSSRSSASPRRSGAPIRRCGSGACIRTTASARSPTSTLPRAGPTWEARDYRMLARNGRVVWIADDAVLEQDDSGRQHWHGVLYDISDRKRAEAELEVRAAQQAAVAQLGQSALEGQELAGLMHEAVATAAAILDVECAHVLELRPAAEGFTERATVGWPEEGAGGGSVPNSRASLAGFTIERGARTTVRDWSEEQRFDAATRAARTRPAQRDGPDHRRARPAVRRARAPLPEAPGVQRGRRQLRPVARERAGRGHRQACGRGRDATPGAARPAHAATEQDPVRRPAGPCAAAVTPARIVHRRAVLRHRPLQADQRQPRPRCR